MAKEKDPLAVDPLEKVMLEGLKKFTCICSLLSNEEREQLVLVLLNNIDVFSWSPSDMVRINLMVTSHNDQTNKTESEAFSPGSPSNYLDGSRQFIESRFH